MFIIKTRESTINENGNKIQFGIKKNASNLNMQHIRNFFYKRILKNSEISEAENGLYTWILKKNGNMYAAKTITKQEIGTLHINLDMLTKKNNEASGLDNTIYAAGELRLNRNDYGTISIEFNLLSGTYMVKLFKNKTLAQHIALRNSIIDRVKNVFTGFGIESKFLECLEASCSDEEKIGGMKLIETSDIRTSAVNIALFNSMFERKISGGNYNRKTKRNRYISRYNKTKTKSKTKSKTMTMTKIKLNM